MTKPRVTSADRLSNIIEVVELGRRSGLLTVERGSHQTTEQGEVYFTSGRAIFAAVEGLRGRDALSVLAGWGQCRFAFDANQPAPAPNIPQTPQAPQQQPGRPATPPQSGSHPSLRSAPSGFDWGAPSNRPIPDPMAPLAGSQPGFQPGFQPGSQPGFQPGFQPGSQPGRLTWPTSWPGGMPSNAPSNAPSSMPSTPSTATGQLAWPTAGAHVERRPRRAPDVRDLITVVNTYNLSRNHRTLLLLADGEHTILDLARLSSKSVDEVLALLSDLERRGLIYY